MPYNHSTVDSAIAHLRVEIAKTPTKQMEFPTNLSITKKIQEVLDDEGSGISDIASVLRAEPVVAARIIQMANSVAVSGATPSLDIVIAIARLGITRTRNIALAIAMSQFTQEKSIKPFADLATKIWRHSICSGIAAEKVAKYFTKFNSNEAFFLGAIHDVGAFYLLHKAAEYTILLNNKDEVTKIARHWHSALSVVLMLNLGIPEDIAMSVKRMDGIDPDISFPPKDLGDVLYIANALACSIEFWEEAERGQYPLSDDYLALIPEIEVATNEMINNLL